MYDTTFQAKVWPVIISAMETYIAPAFNGKLSKDVAIARSDFPYGIYQSQDGGGKNDDYIGQNGWIGIITLRSIDTTLSGAWNRALSAAQLLPTLDHATYDIKAHIVHPIHLPVEKLNDTSVYTAGLSIEFQIKHK
jgi:hypothetical protein